MSKRKVLSLEVTIDKAHGVDQAIAVFNGEKYYVVPDVGMQINQQYGIIGKNTPYPEHDGTIMLSVYMKLERIKEI